MQACFVSIHDHFVAIALIVYSSLLPVNPISKANKLSQVLPLI